MSNYCTECGRKLSENAKFCSNCGHKCLGEDIEATSQDNDGNYHDKRFASINNDISIRDDIGRPCSVKTSIGIIIFGILLSTIQLIIIYKNTRMLEVLVIGAISLIVSSLILIPIGMRKDWGRIVFLILVVFDLIYRISAGSFDSLRLNIFEPIDILLLFISGAYLVAGILLFTVRSDRWFAMKSDVTPKKLSNYSISNMSDLPIHIQAKLKKYGKIREIDLANKNLITENGKTYTINHEMLVDMTRPKVLKLAIVFLAIPMLIIVVWTLYFSIYFDKIAVGILGLMFGLSLYSFMLSKIYNGNKLIRDIFIILYILNIISVIIGLVATEVYLFYALYVYNPILIVSSLFSNLFVFLGILMLFDKRIAQWYKYLKSGKSVSFEKSKILKDTEGDNLRVEYKLEGKEYENALSSLYNEIKQYKKRVFNLDAPRENIENLLAQLCYDRESSIKLLENFSRKYDKDLIRLLISTTDNYDRIKSFLKPFIDYEIVEEVYPHKYL